MKHIILLFTIIFILFACSLDTESGSVTFVFKTPVKVDSIQRNVIANNSTLDLDSLDSDRFKYDVVLETDTRRLSFFQLGNDEEKNVTVPTGIPIDIRVGVYYTENSRTKKEEYNVYLATDSIENIIFMAGQSETAEFVLDLSNPLFVDTFFGTDFSSSEYVAEITGGVMTPNNVPVFTIQPLVTSGSSVTEMLAYNTNFSVINRAALGLDSTQNGKIFETNDPTIADYWYVQEDGIYCNSLVIAGIYNSRMNTADVTSRLEKVIDIKSIQFGTPIYYFLDYGGGYIAGEYTGLGWDDAVDMDFGSFNTSIDGESFLQDVYYDSDYSDMGFFATTLGLFFITDTTIKKFADGDKSDAIEECNKIIQVFNPYDKNRPILVKAVASDDDYIYLGTRRGFYRIDKNSSQWSDFEDASGEVTLAEEGIEKLTKIPDEVILSIDKVEVSGKDILVMATPNRIWFYNTFNSKTDSVSVWDGLPFIPIESYSNTPNYIDVDYKTHQLAPVNFVLFDSNLNEFWIGTDFGLARVSWSDLF
ncbi:MAG: hypothetical protein MJB14_05975 [Spirochaetes bacterium]|nr:hypothetical protein [Spirochaetota bacterium]